MRPDDNQQDNRVGTPQTPQRSYVHAPPSRDPQYRQQEATANLIRSQLDTIYAGGEVPATEETEPAVQPSAESAHATTNSTIEQPELETNPYARTHSQKPRIQAEQWKQYHSAWQDYYKRYYEGYYVQHLVQTKQSLEAKYATSPQPSTEAHNVSFGSDTLAPEDEAAGLTRQRAVYELRKKLLDKVQQSAKKARRSRHFIPVAAAFAVIVIFVFLQYNQVLIANVRAYVSPGTINPQNIVANPTQTVEVGPESRLIIPKINVDTPVFYNIGIDEASQNKAMENGVAHFAIPGANSRPGEVGNTVLSGHSSNDVFAAGNYKFIFMQLEKLEVGDTIYAHYDGIRYTYVVTGKEEVLPTQVSKLVYSTDKPVMTLITCTPLGTALRRLLVTAEQVNPTPVNARPAPEQIPDPGTQTTIPGQGAPTLFERMFGA